MENKGGASLKILKKYIKKYWGPFTVAILFLIVEALGDLLQPTILASMIDKGVAQRDLPYVIKMGGIMVLIVLVGAMGAVARNIISSNVSQSFGADLRLDLYKKIQNFSLENMDHFERSSLITRLTNDVTQFQNFINGLMRIFVKAPILCVGSMIMAARINLKMAWILIIIVPIVFFITYMNLKLGYPLFKKVQDSLDKVNGIMREYLGGVRVVKAFNRFKYERDRFEEGNEELKDVSIKTNKITAVFSPVITIIINLGIVGVLWIGAIGTSYGTVKVGEIMAFINYMTQILFSLTRISFILSTFIRAKVSFQRVSEVLNEEENQKNGDIKVANHKLKGEIEFSDVKFSYKNSEEGELLKDITFSCKAGQTIGIIGSTGSGKSTLVNLIPRFYDVKGGEIRVDSRNVDDFDVKDLRENIALVPQKNVLFTGTILENIRWGRKDASIEEVEKAAKIAMAHDFILKCPNGYDTVLGRGGVNLSGGQKQRISIARAIVKNPSILILDDCTSAIDASTENIIRKNINEYSKDLTTIIISQRISSIIDTDMIIVLDDGSIVGTGKHDDLLNKCDVYKDIVRSQFGREVLQNGKEK